MKNVSEVPHGGAWDAIRRFRYRWDERVRSGFPDPGEERAHSSGNPDPDRVPRVPCPRRMRRKLLYFFRDRPRPAGLAAGFPFQSGRRVRPAGPRNPCGGRQRPDLRRGAGRADPDPRRRGRAPDPLSGHLRQAGLLWRAGSPQRGVPSGVRVEKSFLRGLYEDPGRRHGGRPLPRLRRRRECGRPRQRGSPADHSPALLQS